jgi:hypothetical protein
MSTPPQASRRHVALAPAGHSRRGADAVAGGRRRPRDLKRRASPVDVRRLGLRCGIRCSGAMKTPPDSLRAPRSNLQPARGGRDRW